MKPVYVVSDNIISSLGFKTGENIRELSKGTIGIRTVEQQGLTHSPTPLSLVDTELLYDTFVSVIRSTRKDKEPSSYTKLEQMIICSVYDALSDTGILPYDPGLVFILSTTKGNINLLEDRHKMTFSHKRLFLWELARVIQNFFGFVNTPLVISNACISGVVAIIAASRYLRSGTFDKAVVTGADLATEFVISGFQSFQSLSPGPCRPYDLNRNGLSLGEACGTIVLSSNLKQESGTSMIKIAGGSVSNDANHISGPSRTGEELALAIRNAIKESEIDPGDIGYVSAHGTATLFNDEMEAKAMKIAGLTEVPLNSLKGYWGHTLGAAGLIESVATVHQVKENVLFGTAGYEQHGVSEPIQVLAGTRPADVSSALKTASGFGGCNAAIVIQK